MSTSNSTLQLYVFLTKKSLYDELFLSPKKNPFLLLLLLLLLLCLLLVLVVLSVETFHVRIYFYRVPPVSFSTMEARGKLDAGWRVQPILEIVFPFINHGG